MTNKEKMRMIEDSLGLGENTIDEETLLGDIHGYDSMARLTLIVLCDDEFKKMLSGEQIKEFKTVKDVLEFMG